MASYTQEDLENASTEMVLASLDYDDNTGSSDRHVFWAYFEEKRRNYVLIRDELNKGFKDPSE